MSRNTIGKVCLCGSQSWVIYSWLPYCIEFWWELCELFLSFLSRFLSALLTAVLTHHLAWVPTVMPSSLPPITPACQKPASQTVDLLAKSHPYNPLWAQLGKKKMHTRLNVINIYSYKHSYSIQTGMLILLHSGHHVSSFENLQKSCHEQLIIYLSNHIYHNIVILTRVSANKLFYKLKRTYYVFL